MRAHALIHGMRLHLLNVPPLPSPEGSAERFASLSSPSLSMGSPPTTQATCEWCDTAPGTVRHGCPAELFTTGYFPDPWEDAPEVTLTLCDDCDSDTSDTFAECQACHRNIAMTAPNGMRSYITLLYMDTEEEEERAKAYGMDDAGYICTKCLQDHRIAHGLLPSEVKEGTPLHADFYNYDELRAAGYEAADGDTDIFVRSDADINDVHRRCAAAMAQGSRVLLDLEASGMGLEGYVGIWTAPAKESTKEEQPSFQPLKRPAQKDCQ
jgi:hypothetical protein